MAGKGKTVSRSSSSNFDVSEAGSVSAQSSFGFLSWSVHAGNLLGLKNLSRITFSCAIKSASSLVLKEEKKISS